MQNIDLWSLDMLQKLFYIPSPSYSRFSAVGFFEW